MTIGLLFLTGCGAAPQETPSVEAGETAAAMETTETSESGDGDQSVPSAESTALMLTIGETELTATLEDNSSTQALIELLMDGPLTIEMHDYGSMEKVGPIGQDLPRNDESITAEAGDLILYQGNSFVIYYAPNSWDFTRLGKLNDITSEDLREILGNGNVTVVLSLEI